MKRQVQVQSYRATLADLTKKIKETEPINVNLQLLKFSFKIVIVLYTIAITCLIVFTIPPFNPKIYSIILAATFGIGSAVVNYIIITVHSQLKYRKAILAFDESLNQMLNENYKRYTENKKSLTTLINELNYLNTIHSILVSNNSNFYRTLEHANFHAPFRKNGNAFNMLQEISTSILH